MATHLSTLVVVAGAGLALAAWLLVRAGVGAARVDALVVTAVLLVAVVWVVAA